MKSSGSSDSTESKKDTGNARRAWTAFALLVFAVANANRLSAVWEAGLESAIPSRATLGTTRFWVRSDQQFVVWAVARNARTLATRPLDLFEAEQCFPDEQSLALGEPIIAMGLLGTLAWLASDDPVFTYNFVIAAMSMIAALAMYALIVAWTGVPAAGIVAGLLFAFQGQATLDAVHPYSADTTWGVLAMLFATRWFAGGRWRDACALSAVIAMQIATSFYPLVAVSVVALPFVGWLLGRFSLRKIRWLQVLLVASVAAIAVVIVLGPYVENQSAGVLADRTAQHFRQWADYAPGGATFFGWWPSLLVLLGLLAPSSLVGRSFPGLRLTLAAGGLLVAVVAAGPRGVPTPFGSIDLYSALASFAPGFDSVRIPWKISIGVHLVMSVFAGFGTAALLAAIARLRPDLSSEARTAAAVAASGAALVMLTWGSGRSTAAALAIRPAEHTLRFFEDLEALGNRGAIFETPVPPGADGLMWPGTVPQLLLSAYHHRPTSACYPSHPPRHQQQLESIEKRLPERDAIEELRTLGFTTIVLRHETRRPATATAPKRSARGEKFRRAARGARAKLSLVLETPWASAYEIRP